MMAILTAKNGTNADLFPDILSLYAKEGYTIADVTYGKGSFWKKTDKNKYNLLATDLKGGIDLRILPYLNESLDVLVLDPPYAHSSKTPIKMSIEKQYALNSIQGRDAIQDLYHSGIVEGKRVLKDNGILILKCQDEIMSGRQWWNHIELMQYCFNLGFIGEDLFILVQNGHPTMRHKYQIHARKNHSYFIVLRKKPCHHKLPVVREKK